MRHLHDQEVIQFDHGRNGWAWSEDEVMRIDVSSNVVELLVQDLEKAPEEARRLIRTAACIGNRFDARLLARACGRSLVEVLRLVSELIEQGFVMYFDPRYELLLFQSDEEAEGAQGVSFDFKFAHDRVQQAALSLEGQDSREAVHLAIGREYLGRYHESPETVTVFSVVDQLNAATDCITSRGEKLELVELNLEAGREAMRSIAYEAAERYLVQGLELLGDEWEGQYELGFRLSLCLADSRHLGGKYELSAETSKALVERAKTDVDKCEVLSMVVAQKVQLFEIGDALSIGLEALGLVGLNVPENPTNDQVSVAAERVKAAMAGRSVASILELGKVEDERLEAAHALIAAMYDAAYIGNPQLLGYLVYTATALSIENGTHLSSPAHFVYYAALLSSQGEREALEWGKLANALNDRDQSMHLRSKVCCIIGTIVNHVFEPYRLSLPFVRESVAFGKSHGDYNYATYASLHGINGMWLYGMPLNEIRAEAAKGLQFARQIDMMEITFRMQMQLVDVLAGETENLARLDGQLFDEPTFLEEYESQPYIAYDYYIKRVFLAYFAGDYRLAYEYAKPCAAGIGAALFGSNVALSAQFYLGLAIAAWSREAPETQRPVLMEELQAQIELVQVLASRCPESFGAAERLLLAEQAGLNGGSLESVLGLFDKAIEIARSFNQPNHAAIAAECAANYVRKKELPRLEAAYIEDAMGFCQRWGAFAKTRLLAPRLSELLRDTGLSQALVRELSAERSATQDGADVRAHTSGTSAALGVESIVKGFRGVSNEVRLEILLERLIKTVVETGGADRACLMLPDDAGQLRVQAVGATVQSEDGWTCALSEVLSGALPDSERLPVGVIQHAQRSQATVVLGMRARTVSGGTSRTSRVMAASRCSVSSF